MNPISANQDRGFIIPIGGGGLISGMATAAKALRPELRVIGVEAELYPSMHNVVTGADAPCTGDTLAEGIAVKHPGELTRLCPPAS